MKHIDVIQGTIEWHEARYRKIGGSTSKGLFVKSDTLMIDLVGQFLEDYEDGTCIEISFEAYQDDFLLYDGEFKVWVSVVENWSSHDEPDDIETTFTFEEFNYINDCVLEDEIEISYHLQKEFANLLLFLLRF